MATCFETSTSSFSFLSDTGGEAARTRTEREAEAEDGESCVVAESRFFFVFLSEPFTYPPVKIKYVTTAKPNINNSNQTREIASTAIFLTALSIVAYVTRAFESERAG
jgi:hypothetical protein